MLKSKGRREMRRPLRKAVNDLPSHSTRQKTFQLSRSNRVLELSDRLGFDLANALAGDFEDSADFFERVCVAVADAVAELDDLALSVGQRFQDLLNLVLEHFLGGGFDGIVGLFVF